MGMYAYNTSTGLQKPGCLVYRQNSSGSTASNGSSTVSPLMAKIMGTCGVAPRAAAALPTSICADRPGG